MKVYQHENVLFQGYRVSHGYDEVFAPDGSIRPTYEFLANYFFNLSIREITNRTNELARRLQETSFSYSVSYSGNDKNVEPQNTANLDCLPYLVSSQEWQKLEAGLIQRAELFQLILHDIYTEQRLLRKGLIPAEVIFAHPGFLRPAYRSLPAQKSLYLYGADLYRNEAGEFVLLSDITQDFRGMGTSLRNRIVLSQVFPSLYRESHVHRVAVFFRTLRQILRGEGDAAVVLSSQDNPDSFREDAYLAQYLGFPLVQADDLVVYASKVYLKAVDGAKEIQSIFRRLFDAYCDSLELSHYSQNSVPGLLAVQRMGQVQIVPALGVSVLENLALIPYLPAIAKYFLGEELRLNTIPTYWCGDEKHLKYVLKNWDKLIILPIHDSLLRGHNLTREKSLQLKKMVLREPHAYVAQEIPQLSLAPVWQKGVFSPAKIFLRTFLVAEGNSYQVYPGGTARALVQEEVAAEYLKDIWVIASEREMEVSLLDRSREKLVISRFAGYIPSRVADNMFWLGRYLERIDMLTRYLLYIFDKIRENPLAENGLLRGVLRSLTRLTGTWPGFCGELNNETQLRLELKRVIYQKEVAGTLAFNINAFMYAGRNVADRLSQEMNSVMGHFPSFLQEKELEEFMAEADQLLNYVSSMYGLIHENMLRNHAWRFLEIGRSLERVQLVIRLVSAFLDDEDFGSLEMFEALLKIADCYLSYRRRYHFRVDRAAVLDILVYDEGNPRSLVFQLDKLTPLLEALPPSGSHSEDLAKKNVLKTRALLEIEEETLMGSEASNKDIVSLFHKMLTLTQQMGDHIRDSYFRYVELQRQLEDLLILE
ncbi:MAG: circularly permuted type 2 ATP-grasp protein [Leptospiraceae bacterium]|nr:circularly permuted type 2 ATP-grasp protein [Leptospiraceae bacterium]